MNQRDKQFQNFANLLWEEIMEMTLKGYGRIDVGTDPAAYELLIARRAYDLACHIVQVQAQGTDLCFAADPRWIQGRVELTPDMTELPKDAQ